MSNPAVYPLYELYVKRNRIRIEDNLGESIHIHIGDFRITMTIEEFRVMVEQMRKSARELLDMDGIDLDLFDARSFDWDWIARYEHIKKISIEEMRIGDLLTVGESDVVPSVRVIIPISKCRLYKALCGDYAEIDRFDEVNDYGVSNRSRLERVMKHIKDNGYPFDNKYILVNQYNQIYDGDHRAACLLYMYGPDAKIPVIRIYFDDELSLEEQKENAEKRISEYLLEQKEVQEPIRHWSEDLNVYNGKYECLLEEINTTGIDYYIIPDEWHYENGDCVADQVIIVEENRMVDLCKKINISYYGKSVYRYYYFLYSMQRGVYVETQDANVLIFDRISCKSKFEKSIVPLDKRVQKHAWITRQGNNADINVRFVFVVVDALLNGNGFSKKSIDFIESNYKQLQKNVVKNLLQPVFFEYTDKLLEHILSGNYKVAYTGYVTNVNY